MAPSGKRPVGNADRLSDLHDGLIHSIMSFLTAREAVQTCVLSRRWEDLWCSMSCLDIDERQFRIGSAYYKIWEDMSEDEDDIDSASLEEFVNNLLMFHSAPRLDRFRFHVASSHGNIKFVNSWIRRGIKRCPKVVEIHSTIGCKLPHLGGSSSSRLNRLHLTGIALDITFTHQLRSTCPVLDDLELKWCRFHDDAEIVSFTLKRLTVEDCTTDNPSALTIKAPSLTYLHLVITAPDHNNWQAVVLDLMPRLNKATICLKASTAMLPCKLLSSLMFAEDLQLTGLRTLVYMSLMPLTSFFPILQGSLGLS
ncbi:hypothetical protein ACQ4PT_010009 [Festuca glaucescens]